MMQEIIPISLIRSHLKIDDDPTVSDVQLELYRSAALEAFESLTGYVVSGERTVTQTITSDRVKRMRGTRAIIDLNSPTSDGVVTLYGGNLSETVTLFLAPGDRRAVVEGVSFYEDISFCSPCGTKKKPLTAVYKTGASCGGKIPPGVVIGCLKYIAWQVQNPGDVPVTVQIGNNNALLSATNNAIYASGAYEEWKRYIERIAF